MPNPKDLRDLHRQLVSDGVINMSYKQFEDAATAKGKEGVQNRQDLHNIAREGGYFNGDYKAFSKYFVPVTPQKKEQMKQQVRQTTGRQAPAQPQKPAATPQGQKPKPVQQPKATPNKPDSAVQQYMPTVDPTASNGKISRVRPQQGTGVLKRDAQIMADDSLSAADKVALINDNRRRRGQRERDFNDYQEAARDAGVNMSNPVEGFTKSVEAGFQPDHFFTDSDGNVLDYKPDNYVNKSPVTQYNDRIKEIADEINYYNTKQDMGGGGTTRIEDAINAAYEQFVRADDERMNGAGGYARMLASAETGGVTGAIERGSLREKYAGIDAVAEAAYNSFPDEVKQKYGEDAVYSAIYQATLSAMQENARPKNYGEYLAQKLISTVPAILYKAAVRANAGGRTTLSDIADMETAKYEQELDKQGFVGQVKQGIGTGVSFVADPTMYIPFGGGAGNLVGRGIASVAAKQAVGRGLEAGAVRLASKAAGSKIISRGLVHGVSGGVQMAAYEEALGLANMANGSGQNFWDVTGEALETGAIMVPLGFVSQGARVVKGRTATAIADKGLSRGAQWAANTGAKLGINTTAFIAEAGIFASPDLIKMAVNGTYTNEQARDVVNHSIASLAGIKVAGAFNPTHIEQTMQQVRSVVKGTMGTELALDRHDSEALERLGYPKIQGDNIMSLFMPLGERPEAREGGGYFSMYSQIVLDERVPWSTRAKLIYVATGMLPETGVRPNSVRKTTDENGRIVVTTLQGNNPISQRFFDKKHSASADSYLRKVSHDVERMNFEGTKQDIMSEHLGGMFKSKLVNDALAKDPKSRTPEEQKLVDDYNHAVWEVEELMLGVDKWRVENEDKLPDPEKALKKPEWERTEAEKQAVQRYGERLNKTLHDILRDNYADMAADLAWRDATEAADEMSNKQDGNLYQCQLRGEEGVWYTVVDFDGTIEQGETGMDVTPGPNGDKMMVRNMSTGETKMVTLAELTNLSTDRYIEVRNALSESMYNNYTEEFIRNRRKALMYGKQPQNAEEGERLTLAADDVDPTTGLRPEYIVIDKDVNSGTYIVEDTQGNRRLINGHDILQKITDTEPQIPTQINPQVPPTGPQTPHPAAPQGDEVERLAFNDGDKFTIVISDDLPPMEVTVVGRDTEANLITVRNTDGSELTMSPETLQQLHDLWRGTWRPAQEPPAQQQGEAPAMPEQGEVFKLKVGDEFKDAEVIGKDDTGIIVRYEDGGMFRTEHLTPEELASRLEQQEAPAAPATPPAQGEGGAPAEPETPQDGIPRDGEGNRLYHKLNQKAVEEHLKGRGLDDEDIMAIADSNINKAQKDLDDANTALAEARASGNEDGIVMAKAIKKDAQERLDWWNKFKEGYGKEEPAGEQPPVGEGEGGEEPDIPQGTPRNTNIPPAPIPEKVPDATTPEEKAAQAAANAKRYNDAEKLEGHRVLITLPNGEKVTARYKVVPHDVVVPSHDPFNGYRSTPGYAEDAEGRNVNDRDYSDPNYQFENEKKAQTYDGRAITEPPVVNTGENYGGSVLGGNDRTMAGQLAATRGTDVAYLDALDYNIEQYGISRRALREFMERNPHARLVLEVEGEMPMTTESMAKFNQSGMKSSGTAQSTNKVRRLLTDKEIRDLAGIIGTSTDKTFGDLSRSPSVAAGILRVLKEAGIILENEQAEFLRANGSLSRKGEALLQEIVRASILDERGIKALETASDDYNLTDIEQRIDQITPSLIRNAALGEMSLRNEISRAIEHIRQTYEGWANGKKRGLKGSKKDALVAAANATGGSIEFDTKTEDEIASEQTSRILSLVFGTFSKEDAIKFFNEYEKMAKTAQRSQEGFGGLFGETIGRVDILKELARKYGLKVKEDNGPEQGQGQPGETETPGGNGGGNQGNGRPSGTSGTRGEGGERPATGSGEGEGPRSGEGPVTPPRPGAPQGGGEPPKGEGEPPKPEEPGKPAGEPAGGPAASEPHQLTVDEINGLNLSQSTKENAIDYVNGDRGPRARVAYAVALKEWERVNGKSGEEKPETPPTTPEDKGPQEPPKGGGGGTTGRGGGKPSTPNGGGKPAEPKPAEPKPEGEGPKDSGDDIDLGGLDELGGFEGLFGKKESNESRRPSREGEIVNEARYIPEEATEEQNRAVEKVIDVLAGIGKQLLEKKGMRTQSELVDFMRQNKQIRDALDRIGFDEEDKSNLYNDMWGQRIDTPNGRMRLNEYAEALSKTDKPKQDDKPKQIVSPIAPTVKNVVYKPNSKGKTNESIIPASMAQAVKTALSKINDGDTDGFVMDKVGFKDKDELYEALNAEQIDGVALAISAIERGEGLILGDMTGIGKGRQLAAVIRYARKEGIRPVFVTEKPGLFKDMMRDLLDVGADTPNKPFRPLILASGTDGDVTASDGSKVKAADAQTIEKLLSGDLDKLAKGYDALFVTYANINRVLPDTFLEDQNAQAKETTHNANTETKEPPELTKKKLNLIAKWARGSIVVMDEAHNAAGTDSAQAIQWREIIDTTTGVNAKGVVMASATYAKSPKNYVLYALRTPIKEAHLSSKELLDTFAKGGVPLQEWLASQLTGESYIRRERDMTGVNFDYRICVDGYDAEHPEKSTPEALEKVKAIRKANDKAAMIANTMLALDVLATDKIKQIKDILCPRGAKGGAVSVLVQQADGTYKEEMVDAKKYKEPLKLSNSPFTARIAAINAQLFMAEKAESAADAAIKAIENGELPMIVFENTFDSLMKDLPTDDKGVLESTDYAQAFVRYLEQLGNFTIKLPERNANGAQEVLRCRIDLTSEPDFAIAKRLIEAEGVGLHVSPVDRIRERLEEAGYKVGELSGREYSIQKLADGKYHKVKRKTEDPDKVTDDYNTGKIDVLLINASGSTGRSMHNKGVIEEDGTRVPGKTQSGEVMTDRIRHQIYVQNFNNETTMVQAMGRIDRTGQMDHGKYTFLMTPVPAETNILMRAQRKREQLKANTTAQQDRNSFDAVNASDFINKYGDEVVAEYLETNPRIANALQIPLRTVRDGTGRATQDLAKRATANAYTLTCDQQQEFYDDVQAAYDEYVKVLKENGDYDLETQVVDLQAETLADHMFVRGSHESDSMFSQDTNIARCRVKVQRKPMKVEEIEQHIAEVTGAEDKYEYEEKFQEKFDKHFADMEADVEKEFENKELTPENDAKKNDKLSKIRLFKSEAQRLMKDFPLDLLMPFYADTSEVNDAQGRITTESMPHAIVYDVKLGRTLGSSTIVFAVNDGRQKVAVRMNDDATFRYLRRLQIMPAGDFNRSEWNKSQGDAYEDAYIITGNLIGAYHSQIARRGRMIRYTDSEGNLHTGILMPRNFKTKDIQVEKPISEFYNKLIEYSRYRRKDILPVFANGQLEIEPVRNWANAIRFVFSGDLAKSVAGDPDLEALCRNTSKNKFEVVNYSNRTDNSIQKFLNILAGRYGVYASVPIDPAYFMTKEERDTEAEERMFRVNPDIEDRGEVFYPGGYRGKAYVVHVPEERMKNVDATSDWYDNIIKELADKGYYGLTDKATTNKNGKRVYKEFRFQNRNMAEEFIKMVNNEPVRPLAIDEKSEASEPNWEEVDRSQHTYHLAEPGEQLIGADIAKTFGFRNVDTGNESADGVRDLYNAFMTMAMILNIHPKSISLGGNMDVNMLDSTSAARELGENVIAVYSKQGQTSSYTGRTQKKMKFRSGEKAFPLAHEWLHALDNYFGAFGLKNEETGFYEQNRMASESADKPNRPWTARPEMREAWNGLLRSLVESGFFGRLENEHFFKDSNFTDSSMRPQYWGKRTEMLARAFEPYLRKKITENADNLSLFDTIYGNQSEIAQRMRDMITMGDANHHDEFDPTPKEQAVIDKAFDKFFETIRERRDVDTGRVIMYEQAKPGETKRESTMRETRNLNRVLAKTGLANSVTIDSERDFAEGVFASTGRPMRTLDGIVYGYTDSDGNIHLNAKYLNFETPIHEYGHLWSAWAKKNHGDLWQRGVELAKESDAFKKLKEESKKKGSVYNGMTDDQLADEVLADAIGKKGQDMYDQKDWTRTARVRHWLTQLWHRIGEALGFRKRMKDMAVGDMSFDDIIRTAAGDILSGKRLKDTDPDDRGPKGRRFSSKGSVPTFYSNAARAVENVKQNKATAEQWKAMLTKAGGIKAGEDKWMGLSQWLDEHKGQTLTKEEVAQFVADNGIKMEEVNYGGVKYVTQDDGTVTIEGHPEIEMRPVAGTGYYDYYYDGNIVARTASLESAKESAINDVVDGNRINAIRERHTTNGLNNKREIAFVVPDVEPYQESDGIHFGPENKGRQIMWVRFGETTDTDGNRVLVIDEVQSNRHQDAREVVGKDENDKPIRKGYKKPIPEDAPEVIAYNKANKEYKDYLNGLREKYGQNLAIAPLTKEEQHRKEELTKVGIKAAEELREFYESNGLDRFDKGIPAAPFEKNWHEVAMKRMLRLAAEEGFDKVAWTTGEQQAKRYDLSSQISGIEVRRDLVDGLTGKPEYHKYGIWTYDNRGNVVLTASGEMKPERIVELFGKDLGNRILATEEGKKQTIMGEGLTIGGEGMKDLYDGMLPQFMNKYGKRWGVKVDEVTLNTPGRETMHSVDITPEMRESVITQGQPLFNFIGERGARNLDAAENGGRMNNHAIAQEMERAGKSARAIKWATGWERGKDGKWRYEEPDGDFVGKGINVADVVPLGLKLSDVWDSPELFKAYPEFANIPVEIVNNPLGASATTQVDRSYETSEFTASEKFIREYDNWLEDTKKRRDQYKERLNSPDTNEEMRDMLTDIIKHLTKEIDDAPNMLAKSKEIVADPNKIVFMKMYLNKAHLSKDGVISADAEFSGNNARQVVAHEIQHLIQEHEGFASGGTTGDMTYDQYRRLAGETEARNVSRRVYMSDVERRSSLASDTQDVPSHMQTVRYTSRTSESNSSEVYTNLDGNKVYRETREDGTIDREITTLPDGSKVAEWCDENGHVREELRYYPNGEVSRVRNFDENGELTRQIRYDENRHIISHTDFRTDTHLERDENGIMRGMSNGVELKPYKFRFQQVAEPVRQAISSAATSRNQTPAGMSLAPLQPGTTNFDLGGGKWEKATNELAERGVTNIVFDPFNRDAEHNKKAFEIVRNGGFDSVTCNNVLNVIAEPEVRSNVILQAAKALKQGGTAYFTVYEGSGNGEGKETTKGWQNNRKTADYMEEIGQRFGSVERKGKLIIAKDPITDGKADWFMDAEQKEPIRFQQAPANNPAGSQQGNNEQLHIAREYAQDRTRTTTKLYEEVVENSVSLRHVLEDIARKSGKPIADYENVYLAENQSHGMMTTELITFRDRRVNPLNDALRKLAKHYGGEPTKNYVWARHGIERSIYVCFRERAYELAEKEAEAAARARGEEVTEQDINDAYNAMLDELYNATSGYSRRAYLENLETDCANILSAHGDTKPFEVTDKAGLTALNDKRSLVDDKPIENAWEIVKEYESNAGTEGEADVEELFDRLNDISKSMLDYSRDKGMMDKDTVEKIRKMFRFYVPLQGFAEGTMAQDYFEYMDSNPMRAGRAVPNTPKMRGRTGESADPIATLVRNAEMTIAAARRNTVATHLYNLATSRDTDLFAPARAWEAYDAAEDTWVPSTPDFTGCETTKDMMDAIRLHDEQMRQQRELGLAREARRGFSNRLITAQGAPKGLKMSMRQRHEHAVPVRINGKENVIYVLSDPRIAQIVNGTDKGSVDKNNAPFFYQANKLKRIQSGLMTSYNIAFWFANGARDIQNAFLRQAIMNGGGAAARTATQGLKGDPLGVIPWEAMKLYNKAVKGTLDESNKHEKYFKEFFEHGGITGYAFADQVEVIQSRVKKLLEHPKTNPRRLMFAVGELMEKAGGAFEIAPRFATYVASRDGGKSVMQSVADAKEATVNFDRRGARRSWVMRAAAAFYAFLNPGIQGMQNRLHQVRTHPGKTSVLHAIDFAMGYLWKGIAVACLAAMGRKDDEYDTQLTEYDRRNNICFPVGDDDWVKIPINMEDRVIWGLGDAVRNGMDFFPGNRYIGGEGKDEYDDNEDWMKYAGIVSAWFPIDIGSENNFIPTSLQPIYDIYINRKDFRGQSVDWRSENNAQKPEYQRINPYVTGKMWTDASKWWSEINGGDEVTRAQNRALHGWDEINPQHMQYLFQSYLGGIGTTIGQVMSLAETAFSDDDDVKWNSFKFPIANRFWKGNPNEYSASKGERNKATIWKNWAEEIVRRDREYRKMGAEHDDETNTLSQDAKANYEENLKYLELAKEIKKLNGKKTQAKSKATKEGRTLTKDEESEYDNAFMENIPDFEKKFMDIDGKRKVPEWRKHYDDD